MYEKDIVEVLEVIDHMESEMTRKIPSDVLLSLMKNRDLNYEFSYDEEKDFSEQNISLNAKTILAIIFIKYIATAEEKQKIKELMKQNDEQLNDIFNKATEKGSSSNNSNSEIDNNSNGNNNRNFNTNQLIKSENLFKRIINKIMSFLKH